MYELKKQKLGFLKNLPLTAIYINVTLNSGNFWLLSIFSLSDFLNLERMKAYHSTHVS